MTWFRRPIRQQFDVLVFERLTEIVNLLVALHRKVDALAAAEQDLQTDLDNIKTGVGQVADKLSTQAQAIKDLQAQVAAGTPVSQALHAEASGIVDALNAALNPPEAPSVA